MAGISGMTIRARTGVLNPAEFWQERPGLIVHATFRDRVLPTLKPVEVVPMGRYQTCSLDRIAPWRTPYPRHPRNEIVVRCSPTSAELYAYLRGMSRSLLLVPWEHLAFLVHLQVNGQSNGLLVTKGTLSNLCFMQGVNGEVFLVRVFWGEGGWFLRAWSFEERTDRGWNTMNWLLLPVTL